MDNKTAQKFLESLLGKQLRIHTTDARMFVGEFKCTDNECNVILSQSYEHRRHMPSSAVTMTTTDPSSGGGGGGLQKQSPESPGEEEEGSSTSSRFLGLIVIPGQHITKLEVEDH